MRRITGVREAKARFSELLRDVQLGHEWTITERGRPIARLAPVEIVSIAFEERIERLERSGVFGAAPSLQRPLPPPLRLKENLARRLLDESRND